MSIKAKNKTINKINTFFLVFCLRVCGCVCLVSQSGFMKAIEELPTKKPIVMANAVPISGQPTSRKPLKTYESNPAPSGNTRKTYHLVFRGKSETRNGHSTPYSLSLIHI